MTELVRSWIAKHRQVCSYLFFGGLTTLINYAGYLMLARLAGLPTGPATLAAWAASVVFAYVTNRIWVFASEARGLPAVFRELLAFVSARVASGLLDLLIMVVTVDYWGWPDLLMKLLSNLLVVILNYFFSKLFIFRKTG